MKKMIQKVPIPLAGVMLGCAALGNLLQSYSETVRYALGIISAILLLLLLLKVIMFPSAIREDLRNPIMASVAATFPMGLMLLSVYAKPYIGDVSKGIWIFAIVLHVAIILYFTKQFILKFDMNKVFASYFIVYVGIAVAGITAPAHGMIQVGAASFWFGLASLIVLLPVIGIRYIKNKTIPEPAQPLFCIFAAPASLCLVAYLQSITVKSTIMVYILAALAFVLYLVSLIKAIGYLKLKFYPSYAAFTFPFVISAIGIKQTMGYLNNIGSGISFLNTIVLIETIIAVILVCYTLLRFLAFLLSQPKTEV